jgi:hypothetical protein
MFRKLVLALLALCDALRPCQFISFFASQAGRIQTCRTPLRSWHGGSLTMNDRRRSRLACRFRRVSPHENLSDPPRRGGKIVARRQGSVATAALGNRPPHHCPSSGCAPAPGWARGAVTKRRRRSPGGCASLPHSTRPYGTFGLATRCHCGRTCKIGPAGRDLSPTPKSLRNQ